MKKEDRKDKKGAAPEIGALLTEAEMYELGKKIGKAAYQEFRAQQSNEDLKHHMDMVRKLDTRWLICNGMNIRTFMCEVAEDVDENTILEIQRLNEDDGVSKRPPERVHSLEEFSDFVIVTLSRAMWRIEHRIA